MINVPWSVKYVRKCILYGYPCEMGFSPLVSEPRSHHKWLEWDSETCSEKNPSQKHTKLLSSWIYHQVTVLEAKNHLGGRCHDDTSLGKCVGKGAQMINCSTNNPLSMLCHQVRIESLMLCQVRIESLMLWPGENRVFDVVTRWE